MINPELVITERHLPHWTLEGATYFITSRIRNGNLNSYEQRIILDNIIKGNDKYYRLTAAAVMPDHVHIILTPNNGFSLSRVIKGIKGATAHEINLMRKNRGALWQSESFDRIIRNQDELLEKLNYMLNNPVKKGLIDNPWHYHAWYVNSDFNSIIIQ